MVIDATDAFAKRAALALMSPKLQTYEGRTREEEVNFRTKDYPVDFDLKVADSFIQLTQSPL